MLLLAWSVSTSYGYTGLEMSDRPHFNDDGYYVNQEVAQTIVDCWSMTCKDYSCDCSGLKGYAKYLRHANSPGTELNRPADDEYFFASQSLQPVLPHLSGWTATHGEYRIFTVAKQVLTIVGEAKHGLWRFQENGFIREYRLGNLPGISKEVDPMDWDKLSAEDKTLITDNYASMDPKVGEEGYYYPDQKLTDDGQQNYVDLTIYHPKYGGKYDDHVPIDMAAYYCTFSQPLYPFNSDLWRFVREQPRANVIGPLGKRAGLDIRENWPYVMRLYPGMDGQIWTIVSDGATTKDVEEEIKNNMKFKIPQKAFMKNMDETKVNHECYMTERFFFNLPTLHLVCVFDDEAFYLRPDGPYYEKVKEIFPAEVAKISNEENHYPTIAVRGEADRKHMIGLPTYAAQTADRIKFNITGGACPNMGGDLAYYPWGYSGAGWPTNYQEIVPLCCAIAIDIKFMTNLWDETWNSNTYMAANAGTDSTFVPFTVQPNVFGLYDDPYLIANKKTNPYLMKMTSETVKVINGKPEYEPGPFKFELDFVEKGFHPSWIEVAGIGDGVDSYLRTTSRGVKIFGAGTGYNILTDGGCVEWESVVQPEPSPEVNCGIRRAAAWARFMANKKRPVFIPVCKADNTYELAQFDVVKNESFCVNAQGEEFKDSRMAGSSVNCAKFAENKNSKLCYACQEDHKKKGLPFVPECNANGYADAQCIGDHCWCAQPSGNFVPASVFDGRDTKLRKRCESHNNYKLDCQTYGLVAHRWDCARYFRCYPGNKASACVCGPGLLFDKTKRECLWAKEVKCDVALPPDVIPH